MKHALPSSLLGLVVLPLAWSLVGCAAGTPETESFSPDTPLADASTADAPGLLDAPSDSKSSSLADVLVTDGSQQAPDTRFYAHNDTTLYFLDPKAAVLTAVEVGEFDCVGGDGDQAMTDLAVDKDGSLFGISSTAIYLKMHIESGTVRCQQHRVSIDSGTLGGSARFYGLTFAPATPNLGSSETLIAANSNGDLYSINQVSGKPTLVGRFGNVPATDGQGRNYPSKNVGKSWELSGDIVFLANGGEPVGFATVRDCPNPPSSYDCSTVDTLVEIDVLALKPSSSGTAPIVTKSVRGRVLPPGCSNDSCGFGSMYGIAAFQDKVYGFSRSGAVLTINNGNASGTLIGNLLATPPSSNGFAGAGVTTIAPVIAPPK